MRALDPPRLNCERVVPRGDAHAKEVVSEGTGDGMFMGRDGRTYDPATTALEKVPAATPDQYSEDIKTVLYVNGAWTPRWQVQQDMRHLANATGHKVVGVVNASGGWSDPGEAVQDALQSAGDKLGVGDNAATNTVANLMCQAVQDRRTLQVVGQSQGAAIASRAAHQVNAHLAAQQGPLQALSPGARSERQEKLSVLEIRTLGSAGHAFPDGPDYVHVMNEKDVLGKVFGPTNPVLQTLGLARPGQDARVVRINEEGAPGYHPVVAPHVTETYAPHLPEE